MFNIKTHNKVAQKPYEKYNREYNLGPKVDEVASIGEKKLPHRDGYEQTITEDQIDSEHKIADSEIPQIAEKELNSASSDLVDHRNNSAELSVPPINVLVEKIRQNRASEYKEEKTAHWSHTFNEKKQQGSLPKWTKNAPQHDKIVLNNDPQRFSTSNVDPVNSSKDQIKPLTGGVTTADVDKIAHYIKTGMSADYDSAILAILRLADEERRELSDVEKRTVVDLKIARTNELMIK